ncbi:hypothetical protein K227x_37860 [Rubripirellula lacrimiformis]|uniref:4-O-methyl-glucuronoyl methylesterase-like domain-containing protein n=1 Tax=Rubripirellula lacrimiformis TaxID=1930273 RepID=A0A517NE25_9BACT|nr:acetylxylan esterase [Rubripirellula lacrimiformis]QDT05386.1 hypothetical protein K227x_37860 [Rubripirellula lacrimiformis]
MLFRRFTAAFSVALWFAATLSTPAQTPKPAPAIQSSLPVMTTTEDHRDMMRQLAITALRPGPSGNPDADNAANYDEALANPFPDWPAILVANDGTDVATEEDWRQRRRPEIVEAFQQHVYGRVPERVPVVTWDVRETRESTSGDVPVVEQHIVGTVDNRTCPDISVEISMSLTLPKDISGKVPVLMMFGRTAFDPVPEWMKRFQRRGSDDGNGNQTDRPASPTDELIAAGWGVVRIHPASIQEDNGAGLTRGIIGLVNQGQVRKPDDWGSLRAWGWGASRGLDYLTTRDEIDADRVGIEGVSRYGKAALVAMAMDQRFAMGLIGSSGAGGTTPFRRNFGEAPESLASSGEYHWMAGNFLQYSAQESSRGAMDANDLPVDSHQLIALCAPRLTFISYGIPEKGDAKWLDQQGSYMAAVAASPVFDLLSARGLGVDQDYQSATMPPVNQGILTGHLAWRQHDGGHTDAPNVRHFIAWCEEHFGR